MKTAIAIIGLLILSGLTYIGFYNGFYSPKFSIEKQESDILVYQKIHGHYHLSDSIVKVAFNELYEKNGIITTKGFGIYYDDPQKAGKTDIYFDAGCIVDAKDSLLLINISDEFIIDKTLQQSYIVSNFPLKGKMSILFGMLKVYPRLNQYCNKNGYDSNLPVMEIYDRVEKKIHYRRQLEQVSN
jgi:hypothetical protein